MVAHIWLFRPLVSANVAATRAALRVDWLGSPWQPPSAVIRTVLSSRPAAPFSLSRRLDHAFGLLIFPLLEVVITDPSFCIHEIVLCYKIRPGRAARTLACRTGTLAGAWSLAANTRVETSLDPARRSACATRACELCNTAVLGRSCLTS
jgi:hypothetical protein